MLSGEPLDTADKVRDFLSLVNAARKAQADILTTVAPAHANNMRAFAANKILAHTPAGSSFETGRRIFPLEGTDAAVWIEVSLYFPVETDPEMRGVATYASLWTAWSAWWMADDLAGFLGGKPQASAAFA